MHHTKQDLKVQCCKARLLKLPPRQSQCASFPGWSPAHIVTLWVMQSLTSRNNNTTVSVCLLSE